MPLWDRSGHVRRARLGLCNRCAMSLVNGKDTPTDCSISEQYGTKTYCFGDQAAHDLFMKSPAENLAKAQANYSKMFPTKAQEK